MSYQNKNTDEMLMLSVRCIYISYYQFLGHDSKYILDYEYEWYSVYSFIAEISQNQGKYTC